MTNKIWLIKLVPGYAPNTAPILSVLAKRTYTLKNSERGVYSEKQKAFFESDVIGIEGRPQIDPTLHESDLVAFKLATDVIVHGKAHSPKGKKAFYLDLSVQVGQLPKKIVRVFGERHVFVTGSGIEFSETKPFDSVDLSYANAYGGIDSLSDEATRHQFPKNPWGLGFVVKNNPKALQDLLLPSQEDPRQLLSPKSLVIEKYENWKSAPEPQSFGYTGRTFYSRLMLSGLSPDAQVRSEFERQNQLQKTSEIGTSKASQPPSPLPLVNPAFYSGASNGLCVPYLRGDEEIRLIHFDADHPQFTCKLPGERPTAWLDLGKGPVELGMVLHTVEIFKEENQVSLVWRGCAQYAGPESLQKVTQLDFGVES